MADIRTRDVDDLLTVLATLDDSDAIFALLEDLFTVREIRETSQRLVVARLLAAGKSYAAIEAETGASATTIARVSKCLSYGAGGYERALAILGEREGEDIEDGASAVEAVDGAGATADGGAAASVGSAAGTAADAGIAADGGAAVAVEADAASS